MLYGVWRPLDTGARPYGPFVNRNHMATWIIMACPLAFGYLLARAPRKEPPHRFSQRVVNALEATGDDTHLARGRGLRHDAGRHALGVAIGARSG